MKRREFCFGSIIVAAASALGWKPKEAEAKDPDNNPKNLFVVKFAGNPCDIVNKAELFEYAMAKPTRHDTDEEGGAVRRCVWIGAEQPCCDDGEPYWGEVEAQINYGEDEDIEFVYLHWTPESNTPDTVPCSYWS